MDSDDKSLSKHLQEIHNSDEMGKSFKTSTNYAHVEIITQSYDANAR